MDDGVAHLLHIRDDLIFHDAVVGLLPAALRIEVRAVQDNAAIDDCDDLRLERHDLRVLVVAEHRLGHIVRVFLALRALILLSGRRLFLVLPGHHLIERVRYLDWHVGELLHDLRVEAVGVVQLDQLLGGDRPSLQPLAHPLHDGAPAVQRLVVPLLLHVHEVHDVLAVLYELGKVRRKVIDLLANDIGQGELGVERSHRAQRSSH